MGSSSINESSFFCLTVCITNTLIIKHLTGTNTYMCFISVFSLKLNKSNWGLIILKIVLTIFLHKCEGERKGMKSRVPLSTAEWLCKMWKENREWAELGQIEGESLCAWLLSHFHCCFGSGKVKTGNKESLRSRRHQEQEMNRLWVEKIEKLFRVALNTFFF